MGDFDFNNNSHRRYNPLLDSWILVSPHRTQRPWQGQQEKTAGDALPSYDPACYLCPGNTRITGEKNPKYESTYFFVNDYAAVKLDQPDYVTPQTSDDDVKSRLFKVQGTKGNCFVICFSPKHNVTLPLMSVPEIRVVINTWTDLYLKLQRETAFRYMQVFENKGASMGCSNPHPHCQVWCTENVPTDPAKELTSFGAYKAKHNTCLLCDYLSVELAEKSRIVLENDSFVALVPFWAVWPFETMILAKSHVASLPDFTDAQKEDLAAIIKTLTTRYDNLFLTSFPYSMGIHQAPIKPVGDEHSLAHFHMHFYPPLLRGATVRKFLVGYEMLAEPQRDLTAEQAADRLRALDDVHYSEKST
ncbi:galactose-1-phosphate uridyl transferase [Myxozyma melibiosi]|uniref:Galactose-1-phosphate uridylyltransferase n=1 Tax=Myxozyma melibiosi TaxID=54550 RepID=A0ABR1F310_9ASCO